MPFDPAENLDRHVTGVEDGIGNQMPLCPSQPCGNDGPNNPEQPAELLLAGDQNNPSQRAKRGDDFQRSGSQNRPPLNGYKDHYNG